MRLFASRGRTRKRPAPRRAADESDPRRRGLLYLVAGAVTLLAGLVLVVDAMYRQIQRRPDFHVDPLAAELLEAPPWLPEALGEELRHGHGLPPRPVSIFRADLEAAIAEHYRGNPWVESVEAIHKVYPGEVEVELELRRPAALVVLGDARLVPIDRNGTRLPDLPRGDQSLRNLWLPLLQGVLTPPPPVGSTWQDRAVIEGVALVEAVRPQYVKYLSRTIRFTGVDVSNVGGRVKPLDSELAFLTADRVLVEWGRSPASPQPDPLTFEEKMLRLRNVLLEFPAFRGLQRVKLDESPPAVVSSGTVRNR